MKPKHKKHRRKKEHTLSLRSSCIIWPGIKAKGYGHVYTSREYCVSIHRAIYEGTVGKIPNGMVIDHICKNKSCINPRHLEVITQRENIIRCQPDRSKHTHVYYCKCGSRKPKGV